MIRTAAAKAATRRGFSARSAPRPTPPPSGPSRRRPPPPPNSLGSLPRAAAVAVVGARGGGSDRTRPDGSVRTALAAAAAAATAVLAAATPACLLEGVADDRPLPRPDRNDDEGEGARPRASDPIMATSFKQSSLPPPDVRDLGKALAEMHERQKVKLGRLLNDFHRLAEEAATLTRGAAAEEEMDEEDLADEAEGVFYVDIAQEGLDRLTPRAAWDIIARLREGALLRRDDTKRVALVAAKVIRRDPTLVDLGDRTDLETVTVVGDLHGDFNSLFDVFGLVGEHGFGGDGDTSVGGAGRGTPWDGTGAIVFNGDFVDRGDNSLEVMLTLLLLKIAFPHHVYLNRGNHEDAILSTVYGYTEELQARYGTGNVDDIWENIGEAFASLPLCVVTRTAAIMHGGIPSDGFKLSELEAITPDQRSKLKSVLEPGDDKLCQLVQNVLWSDPRPEPGVHPNEDRGAGVRFGPDVTQRFLSDHGLFYLIRSHEPVDGGYEHIECSDNRSAVTVFSSAQYPNGEGYNFGAVIRLSSDGTFTPICFPGQFIKEEEEGGEDHYSQRTFSELAKVIAENKSKLLSAFADQSEEGTLITREKWADVMSHQLDLQHLDWLSLQPYLAPTVLQNGSASTDSGMIDFCKFLDLHCSVVSSSMEQLDDETMELLHKNHAMLLTVFKFLDTNHNGLIDREEFRAGIKLLNKRFPDEHKFDDPDAVFDAIDLDGSGEIELDEFERTFQAVEMPYSAAVFKLFDKDRSGTIDREEFREALKMLNGRLPPDRQFVMEESDVLFDKLDEDGSGELELEEFQKLLSDFHPGQA